MSRYVCTFGVLLALLSAPVVAVPAVAAPAVGGRAATSVLVVGTIHENHAANPNYSYERLVQILARFQPDVICIEIRPVDFRKVPYLQEMMLAATYGFKRGLKVYPIDWWTDAGARQERDEYTKTPDYAVKSAREKQMTDESAIARRFMATYGEDEGKWFRERGLEFFNGDDYNQFVADTYRISMAVYGDHAMNLYYETRNRNMTDLIARAIAENQGKRVVVLAGAEHKHYFDRSLASLRTVQMVRFDSLLPLKPVEIDPEITDLLTNHKARLYFDLSTADGVDNYYAGSLTALVHGRGMDFRPEGIPAGNADLAKPIIDEWGARSPSSTRYRFDLGWYHFLKGANREAIADFEAVVPNITRIEPARMRPFVLRVLGFCYDLAGQREKAVAAYMKGDDLAVEQGMTGEMRSTLFGQYKAKPYEGLGKR